MFTAVVLVCAGLTKNPDVCYTYTLDTLLENKVQCLYSIEEAIKNRYFNFYDEATNTEFRPIDYECINWDAKNI